jgi:hypothetical protein
MKITSGVTKVDVCSYVPEGWCSEAAFSFFISQSRNI